MGVIDQELYSFIVVMAVLTTAMAGPLLQVIYPRRFTDRDLARILPDQDADDLAADAATGRGP